MYIYTYVYIYIYIYVYIHLYIYIGELEELKEIKSKTDVKKMNNSLNLSNQAVTHVLHLSLIVAAKLLSVLSFVRTLHCKTVGISISA